VYPYNSNIGIFIGIINQDPDLMKHYFRSGAGFASPGFRNMCPGLIASNTFAGQEGRRGEIIQPCGQIDMGAPMIGIAKMKTIP
jgi:hypothetical protein